MCTMQALGQATQAVMELIISVLCWQNVQHKSQPLRTHLVLSFSTSRYCVLLRVELT